MKLKKFIYIYFALLCLTTSYSTGRTIEEVREDYLRYEKANSKSWQALLKKIHGNQEMIYI
jgi:type II restriction/modification system DNA methylase subunit YeeA